MAGTRGQESQQVIHWWIVGEWCQGPYQTKEEAEKELDALVDHEVLGNQFWWLEQAEKKPW